MNENILMALEIFWQGLIGVFVVIVLLSLIVYLISRMDQKKSTDVSQKKSS